MPAIAIARFEDEALAVHAGKDHAPSTVRQVKQVLREFREVGARRTSDFTGARISAWKAAHPERTPVTTRSHLRCLRALCERMVRLGYLRVNPLVIDPIRDWARDDAPTARPRRQWALGASDVRRVLELADREAEPGEWQALRLRAYVWALLSLGMRPGELQRLETWDVDLAHRTVSIRAKLVPVAGKPDRWWRPKTVGSSGTIPVGDRLAGVLADWIPRTGCRWLFPGAKRLGPWTSGGVGVRPLDQVRALGRRAGVDLWQKTGRKSVGSNARGAGLTSLERRGLFRHEDESTGDHYDERHAEGLRAAVNKIERYYLGDTGT
jgi:integrase